MRSDANSARQKHLRKTKAQLVDELHVLERKVAGLTAAVEVTPLMLASRDSDTQLIDAIESIRDGFALYDADECLVFCNSQYRDFYPSIADMLKPGASLEDLVRTVYEMDGIRGGKENVEESIKQRLMKYRAVEASHEQQLEDGRWLLCNDRHTPTGGIACVRTDITEQKQAEQALEESLAWLNEAQRIGQVGHWVYDEIEDKYVFASKEHQKIFGEEDNPIMPSWDEFLETIHPDDRDRVDREQTEASETATGYQCEYRIILPNGEVRNLLERGEPIFDDAGEFIKSMGTIQDITEKKRAEEVLREARDELEQRVEERTADLYKEIQHRIKAEQAAENSSRAKSEFLATMSHELRTPLTSIKGSLGLLRALASDDLPSEGRKLLDIAARNSDSMLLLVNELLDYEKILSGSMVIEISTHDLSALTAKVVKDNQGYANAQSVKFLFVHPKKPAYAKIQEHRFEQVLRNLLSNAAKFSEPGSTVEVSLSTYDDMVSVRVKDNGPGIPEEYREQIFEQFSQIDSSSTREQTGTGLGLPISKALTEGMGGTIDFESTSGVGSTFCIRFVESCESLD